MPSTWNDGILEFWNNGQKIDIVPIVPALHHSIVPLFQLWAKRTKFCLKIPMGFPPILQAYGGLERWSQKPPIWQYPILSISIYSSIENLVLPTGRKLGQVRENWLCREHMPLFHYCVGVIAYPSGVDQSRALWTRIFTIRFVWDSAESKNEPQNPETANRRTAEYPTTEYRRMVSLRSVFWININW